MNRIVAEITVVVDSAGTEQTFYFATSGFSTRPTDTPANTYVAGRLKDAGRYRRELFSGTRMAGAVRSSFGSIVLRNDDGALDSWLGYGVSMGRVVLRMGDEDAVYPAGYTHIVTCYAQYIRADFSQVEIVLRDRLHLLEKPIVTEAFAGTGGLEGTSTLSGKLKQWVSGDPGYLPPICVDETNQIYFVQATGHGGLESSFKVYEGGVEITRGTNYADSATMLSTSPTPGQARFWFGGTYAGPVYFRLGSVPIFDLRVRAFGYQSSGATWTLAALAAQAGIAGGTGALTVGAVLVDDSSTYIDVMEGACLRYGVGYFGMNRNDQFVCGQVAAPGASPAYTFTHRNAKGWGRQPVQDMDAPVYSLTVHAGRTWPCNLTTGVTSTMRDYLTRDPWWATVSEEDADILTAHPGAVADVLEIPGRAIQSPTDGTTLLNAYMGLFGVARDCYLCTVPMSTDTMALDLHDTVAIEMPRFGLDSGKNYRVITIEYDFKARQITFGMWG